MLRSTFKMKISCVFILFNTFTVILTSNEPSDGYYVYYDLGDEYEDIAFSPLHQIEKRSPYTTTTATAATTTVSIVPVVKEAAADNKDEFATTKKSTIEKIKDIYMNKSSKYIHKNKQPYKSKYDDKKDVVDITTVESTEQALETELPQNSTIPFAETDLDVRFSFNNSDENDTNIPRNNSSDLLVPDFNNDEEKLQNKFATNVAHNRSELFHEIHIEEAHHRYYSSLVIKSKVVFSVYWVNLDKNNNTQVNTMLSSSHRRAVTVKLSFEFPFYGHLINNVTIATGGFLYTGHFVHSWLAATQYIAPLMANFDTGISEASIIRYLDTGSAFTVEWDQVMLQDEPGAGSFTFQVTLYDTGDMIFVYKKIPDNVGDISDIHHPVKVGISDAYIMDRTIFSHKHKTLYEYHHISFNRSSISNNTVIHLTAQPTCAIERNCSSCLNLNKEFDCVWCPSVGRCSDQGMDRWRQDWLQKGCMTNSINIPLLCSRWDSIGKLKPAKSRSSLENAYSGSSQSMSVPAILATFFTITSLGVIGLWILYAYRNPHTPSGQLLIKYRPNQWTWRRGEARYTAATIHI